MPVGVLISLVVIQLLAHGMTAPLREMTAAARQMARGDYSRRVRATSRDEVGELAHAFNRMAADLAEVDRQRREFVANVSHELRTPISALRAVLENVADGVTPATPDVLESALHQTERLGRLVTQLLDLSRVEAGAAPLDAADLDVAAFVADVAAEAAAGHPDAVFETDVDPRPARRRRPRPAPPDRREPPRQRRPARPRRQPVTVTARPGRGPGDWSSRSPTRGPASRPRSAPASSSASPAARRPAPGPEGGPGWPRHRELGDGTARRRHHRAGHPERLPHPRHHPAAPQTGAGGRTDARPRPPRW